jgi:hypothetical protein
VTTYRLNPLRILDYRCHVPGGSLGKRLPQPMHKVRATVFLNDA